jgi:hypothetical protein
MAKRRTGVGKGKKSSSKKTAKRLAVKKERLDALKAKRGKVRPKRKYRKKKK